MNRVYILYIIMCMFMKIICIVFFEILLSMLLFLFKWCDFMKIIFMSILKVIDNMLKILKVIGGFNWLNIKVKF